MLWTPIPSYPHRGGGVACGLQCPLGVVHPGRVSSLAAGAQAEDVRHGWVSSVPSTWTQGRGRKRVGLAGQAQPEHLWEHKAPWDR